MTTITYGATNDDGTVAAVDAQHLTKRFGTLSAVDDVTFRVRQGEIFAFLGPNGAGKTTTMRILTGLIRADAGEVELFGKPLRWLDRAPLFDVGALIESPAFYPYLSARRNLRVIAGSGR